jgi:hypothetical protein
MEKSDQKTPKNFLIKKKKESSLINVSQTENQSMDLTSHFTEDFKDDLIKMSLIYDID